MILMSKRFLEGGTSHFANGIIIQKEDCTLGDKSM
jgi:hypothetical protein